MNILFSRNLNHFYTNQKTPTEELGFKIYTNIRKRD